MIDLCNFFDQHPETKEGTFPSQVVQLDFQSHHLILPGQLWSSAKVKTPDGGDFPIGSS